MTSYLSNITLKVVRYCLISAQLIFSIWLVASYLQSSHSLADAMTYSLSSYCLNVICTFLVFKGKVYRLGNLISATKYSTKKKTDWISASLLVKKMVTNVVTEEDHTLGVNTALALF